MGCHWCFNIYCIRRLMVTVKEALEGPENKLTHRETLQVLPFPDNLCLCHDEV